MKNAKNLKRVYITDFYTGDPDLEQKALDGVATVRTLGLHGEEGLAEAARDADALMSWHHILVGPRTLAKLTRCKAIVRCGVGFDNVDIRAAGKRGIVVSNVPDYGVDEVADHALAMALALTRGLRGFSRRLHEQQPKAWDWQSGRPLYRNRGRVFGVLGLGLIGLAAALRAQAFGWQVIYCDPHLRPGLDKSVQLPGVSLDELLKKSDVLSLHAPLTEETRHLINASALAKMKRSAVLVNTARGGIVDQAALLQALLKNQIAGAALDVLEQEPPSDNDPLLVAWRAGKLPNLIITPHCAFYSEDGFREMRTKTAEEIRRILTGQKPRSCVNQRFLKNTAV